MKVIEGDLIALAKDGHFDVIVHGCNCFNTMGAGIAKVIANEFPAALYADRQTIKGDRSKLGTLTTAEIPSTETPLIVVNAYTQFNYRGSGPKVDYTAIEQCFRTIAQLFPDSKIGYPMIGAGLAGGDWGVISSIIEAVLDGTDHTLVVLPGTTIEKPK